MKINVRNIPQYLRHIEALKIDYPTFASLKLLEQKAHVAAERYCNGDLPEASYDNIHKYVTTKVIDLAPHLAAKLYLRTLGATRSS